jgi:hypothetical protein
MDTSGIEPDTSRKSRMLSERDKPTTPCARLLFGYYIHGIQRSMCRCLQMELMKCPSYRTHPFRVPEFTADADWDDK